MRIEILHIEGCPNRTEADVRVRAALDALGLTSVDVRDRLIRTPDEAAATEFAGSPTILIDGTDAFGSEARSSDLACRVYRTDQGLAGAPTTGQIEAAIRARL